jgi:hypothetical protein
VIFRHIAAPDAQFAKAPRRFSFKPPWCIRFCHRHKAAIMSSLNPLHAWIMWKQCSVDVSHNVILTKCNPDLADPPGLWVIIPFRFGTLYWTAIGQSTCRFVFGATCPINETSVGNADPNQPLTPLLCAANGWSLIDTRDTRAVCESHAGSNMES